MNQVEERSVVITAMGEPGSVFLEKCEPIIVHREFRKVHADEPTESVSASQEPEPELGESIFMLPDAPVRVDAAASAARVRVEVPDLSEAVRDAASALAELRKAS